MRGEATESVALQCYGEIEARRGYVLVCVSHWFLEMWGGICLVLLFLLAATWCRY